MHAERVARQAAEHELRVTIITAYLARLDAHGFCIEHTAAELPPSVRRAAAAPSLPVLHRGQACPVSSTTVLTTPEIGRSFALGKGPVRPLAMSDGTLDISNDTFAPGWLAAKTLWISDPAYQGPFLIRLRRIDVPGPVGLDESPGSTSLYTPAGPTPNGINGYRDVTGATRVKTPGCVAWQVDGINFSNVIVARLVCRQPSCTISGRRSSAARG